jgi:hypothetical protein
VRNIIRKIIKEVSGAGLAGAYSGPLVLGRNLKVQNNLQGHGLIFVERKKEEDILLVVGLKRIVNRILNVVLKELRQT